MPHRPAGRERGGGRDDRIGVDAVVPVKVRDRPGLSKMLDPERPHAMAVHGAEPGERGGVTIEHGYDPAMGRHFGQ